jgi:hypothetical protein
MVDASLSVLTNASGANWTLDALGLCEMEYSGEIGPGVTARLPECAVSMAWVITLPLATEPSEVKSWKHGI